MDKELSKNEMEFYLDKFIKAAKLQKHALEEGGWGHAGWCNYQRPECTHCNCGVADVQQILREIENL